MAVDFEQACQGDDALAEVHRLITARELQQARVALGQLPESPGRDVATLRLELEVGEDVGLGELHALLLDDAR